MQDKNNKESSISSHSITQEIWHGDCLELMQNIAPNSIDLVVCDPPFGSTSIHWDKIINFNQLWQHYERIVKIGGTIVLFGSGVFSAKLVCSKESWHKYNLVWRKSKCGSPLLAKYRPMIKHEDVIIFTVGGGKHKTFHPIIKSGTPYARTNTKVKTNNHGYGIKNVEVTNLGTRFGDSILDFPQKWRKQDQVHPTQKPVELIQCLISMYSNEGDLVLDNCAGSCTTALASKNLNRNCICIEKEEIYCKIGRKRFGIE